MSDSYEAFKQRLAGRTDVAHGHGASPAEIAAAERELGPLPPDYKALLADFGWLRFGHYEILGLGDDQPPGGELLFVNRLEHEESGYSMPPHLAIVYPLGNGDYDGFDTRLVATTGDSPVFAWTHELPEDCNVWETAPSFAAYLHTKLDRLEEEHATE